MNKIPFIFFLSLTSLLYPEENIETITITAKAIKEQNITSPRSIITEDEITSLAGATTPEIISSVMGVQLSKMGNSAQPSFISIRGSSPEQVLVLLNGKRMNSSQGGGVDLSTIPPESIKEIEVIQGAGSAVYGANAFGGVVNIKTKDSEASYLTLKYGTDLESQNTFSININKNSNNFNISSIILAIYNPGNYNFIDHNKEQKRINSDIKSLSTSLNLIWLIDSFEFSLNNNLYIADKGVPGLVEFPSKSARMEDLEIHSSLNIDFEEIFHFDVSFQNKKRDYTDKDAPLGPIDSNHDYNSISSLISYKDFIELSGNYDYLESTEIDAKYIDRSKMSLFISPKIIFHKLLIKPSIRVDFISEQKPLCSWNMGFSYSIDNDERFILTADIGSAYRLPSFNDLFWPETSFATGNPELKNEEAIITDLSLLTKLTGNLTLKTTLYYHNISNLIQWNPGPGGIWTPKNLGRAEIKGIESELSYLLDTLPINGYIEGRLNYTYLSALNRESGILYNKLLINRAKHKGNLILIYYHNSDLKISLDFSYTGKRYITSANTKNYPGYLLLDINSSYPISRNINLSVYVKNLLNKKYEDYRGYPIPGINAGINIEYRMDLDE